MRGKPFTDQELERARARYGTIATCPQCNMTGDIDAQFGWRRDKETEEVRPQSWCTACRSDKERYSAHGEKAKQGSV